MSKTLDEILRNKVKVIGDDEWTLLGYPEELKQDILQWVADEVIGEDRQHEEEFSSKITKMEQRAILKQHGWKEKL